MSTHPPQARFEDTQLPIYLQPIYELPPPAPPPPPRLWSPVRLLVLAAVLALGAAVTIPLTGPAVSFTRVAHAPEGGH